jgi:hypothetical protein
MLRIVTLAALLALSAGVAHADDADRSAYTRAQAALTEQLNAVITKAVPKDAPAPPAKVDAAADEPALPASEHASR